MGEFPSGQRVQTVNLLSVDFGGSNPPSLTTPSTGRGTNKAKILPSLLSDVPARGIFPEAGTNRQ